MKLPMLPPSSLVFNLYTKMAVPSNVLDDLRKVMLLELEEDDSDDDELALSVVGTLMNTSNNTTWRILSQNPSNPDAHHEDYTEEVVPRYTDHDFRTHFRMYRDAFEALVLWIGPHIPGKEQSVTKKLLATIWLLANPDCYRSVADRFQINKGVLHRCVMEVCNALVSQQGAVIEWPMCEIDQRRNAAEFQTAAGFPGVVGAIDGTYIEIKGPDGDHRSSYICRKGFPAIHLQVVCNKRLMFLDVHAGNAGSVADSRVFKNSDLVKILNDPRRKLAMDLHLIGDSAYPLKDYLLVPFKDNGHLCSVEIKYNKLLSSTRVDVERSIGLLKGKFRRLKYLDMTNTDDVPVVIFACCVLHNFIIIENGVQDEDIDMSSVIRLEEVLEEAGTRSAVEKRMRIAHMLH